MIARVRRCLAIVLALGGAPAPAVAEVSLRELIKEAQNPLPDLVSVPIQNNFNIGYGPYKGLQDGVNIQPVIPTPVTSGLNVITRVVAPLIFNPKLSRDVGPVGGLGDVQVTPFLSPSQPSPWVWGIGPIIQLPTHSNPTLGNNNLGLGPSVALLRWTKNDPLLFGALAYTAWSVNTDPRDRRYQIGSLQPLVTYMFDDGLYVTTSPIIKVDWLASHDRQVLLPVGGGIGKVFHLGKLPLNAELHAYYNVMKQDLDADWQVRFQIQMLFPR